MSTSQTWFLAASKYHLGEPQNLQGFAQRMEHEARTVRSFAGSDSAFWVLPEYLSLAFRMGDFDDPIRILKASQAAHDFWLEFFSQLSQRYQLWIQAGTFLVEYIVGRFRNRAYCFAPDGSYSYQDKLQLTRFERELAVIDPGETLTVQSADALIFGVAVCYDSEFPLPVRAQKDAGMELLLVPSCTDTEAGATRVRVGCLARALENRCIVAQAVTAGVAPWNAFLDQNTGDAAIYGPMDAGFPASGILALTDSGAMIGEICLAYTRFDFADLSQSREQAQVANDLDWPGQLRFPEAKQQIWRVKSERRGFEKPE